MSAAGAAAAAADSLIGDSSLRSARTAPADRTRSASDGVISSQIAGSARPTIGAAKLKNAAVTGASPIAPSGAARPAK
jgi:hypothetical protein